MKVLKKKHGFLIAISLFFMVAGLMFVPTKAMAQTTQGDVALELAELLGFEVTTAQEAVWAIEAVGIIPKDEGKELTEATPDFIGGWKISTEATPDFIASLYSAVNNAINKGTLIPPSVLGNASALVAAAATSAGMASTTAVEAVVAAGGNQASASQGASYGTAVGPGQASTTSTAVTPITPSGPDVVGTPSPSE
ncbi:MAG: hypothetical protein HGJ97_18895 [Desulfosporosinus sp.]|nr:hypothetical protein [Desulfobacteraceae bacterium]MBC2720711.1 hypothetical protein [Desulfobacteraceae bacterium]MBC2724693.1 hypothetical protein [Desulfosporosinus sp.]